MISNNNLENTLVQNKKQINMDSNFGKKFNDDMKSKTVSANKTRTYEKEKLDEFNRCSLFKD